MGWIVVFVLHLFCGMAAVAGVHSQENSTDGEISELYQKFEGDAVHSIMQSWVDAGTNSSWLTDTNGTMRWSFTENPCYRNYTCEYEVFAQNLSFSFPWHGVYCSTKFNPSTLVRSYYLTSIHLNHVIKSILTGSMRNIDSTRIAGGLPPAILNLTSLQNLNISHTINLSGTLPPALFCHLKDLKTLTLRNCSLTGNISIGPWALDCDQNFNDALQILDLSWNSFTSIDTENFLSLQHLNVSNNKLKGEASLECSSIMETIDLSNNFITNISFSHLKISDLKSM